MAVTQAIIDAARADALLMLPSLSGLVAANNAIIVDRSACLIQPDAWGKKQQPALALLICHHGALQLETAGGSSGIAAAGPVGSVSLGKLSVSFAGASLSEDALGYGSTNWGIQYLAMRRTLLIAPLTGRAC